MIQSLLLQIAIVVFPILIFHFLSDTKYVKNNNDSEIFLSVLLGTAGMLTILFPLKFEYDYLIDFRWIPITLAALYAKPKFSVISLLQVIIFRLLLGGNPSLTVLFAGVLIYGGCLIGKKWFLRSTQASRIWLSSLIGLYSFAGVLVVFIVYLRLQHNLPYLKSLTMTFITCFLLYSLTSLICCYFLESIFKNMRLRQLIQETEKIQIIGKLAASIAHEVRNPLTVVRGFLQIAKNDLDDKKKSYMDTAIEELDRAEYIISEYLTFAKPSLDKAEPLFIIECIQKSLTIIESYASMNEVVLSFEMNEDVMIHTDKQKFQQVVITLLKNAIEAMPNGGALHVFSRTAADTVTIFFKDSGRGMTQEQIANLGKPFYTTRDNGTGLGLMVAFRLVQEMHGALSYQSELGKGTTAMLTLTMHRSPSI